MRRVVVCAAVATAAAVALVLGAASPPAGRLVAQNLSRAQIRSMPILERPDRPGHIYGNAVRRRQSRPTAPAPISARQAPMPPLPPR